MFNLLIQRVFAQDGLGPIDIRNWGIGSRETLIQHIVTTLLIVIGAAALIAIIYGGYLYITSAGNPEQAGKGKNAILYAIIGLVIAFSAYAIIRYLIGGTNFKGMLFR